MKTDVNTVLDFQIELRNIPTTLAEAVEQTGSEQEVLDNHVNYVVFHSHNTTIRKELTEFLEEKTGVKRESHMDGDKRIIDEKDTAYAKRLRADHSELLTDELVLEIRTKWSEVNWEPSRRGSGRLAKEYLAVYDQLKGMERLDDFVAKHGLTLGDDEDSNKKIVGLKAKELMEAAARAQKEALLAGA